MMMEAIGRLLEIEAQLSDIAGLQDSLGNERKGIEEQLLREFEQDGIDKLTKDGKTVYIKRDVYPKFLEGKGRADVVAWMKANAPDFLDENYNGNQFGAFIREHDKSGEGLPDGLGEIVEASERYSIKVRG